MRGWLGAGGRAGGHISVSAGGALLASSSAAPGWPDAPPPRRHVSQRPHTTPRRHHAGLANPGPIVSSFYVDHRLPDRVRLDGVVTVVDAKHVSRHLDAAEADAERVCEAVEQVAMADTILLNKADLVGGCGARPAADGPLQAAGEPPGGDGCRPPASGNRAAPRRQTPAQVDAAFLTDLKARLRRVNALAPITTTTKAQVRAARAPAGLAARGAWPRTPRARGSGATRPAAAAAASGAPGRPAGPAGL